ncbi:MAG TPA: NAD-dependent epimerase/dehydratase family protein [Burkholderiales bacterium]|nr:NAD-dependent epimerase/dehydratase family protein [Burkholderiales bacterium]
MRILVTGAGGFIGSHVVRTLLAKGVPASALLLADANRFAAPPGAKAETGDIADPAFIRRLLEHGVKSIYALAATLTSDAEADFGKGLRVNVLGLIHLLEALRHVGGRPKLVYPSSISSFGGTLPETVDDSVAHFPRTSYGSHKAIAELLINDYTRKGFIDGRSLRLPVVLTRPGAPSTVVSDRVAAILREPLRGQDVVCPLDPATRIPVASVQRVAQALVAIHDLPASAFGDTRAMNLPSLSVTIGEMVAAVERRKPAGRITYRQDAVLQAIADDWPKRFVSERASRHGIGADASIDEVIEHFLRG